MISKAWATMRTARSFFPLLRPFIIKLFLVDQRLPHLTEFIIVPVDQAFDDRHLSLLELLLGITASSVGKVNGVTDLDIICEGDIFHLNTVIKIILSSFCVFLCLTHS